MRVTCPSCNKAYTVDESKLPASGAVLKCQACGGKMTVPGRQVQDAPAGSKAPVETAESLKPGSPAWEKLKRETAAEVLRQLGLRPSVHAQDAEDDDGELNLALVAEDEPLFQEVIRDALEKLGYQVEQARSTADALEALKRKPYRIVTVDNRFPDDSEGGYKILQTINAFYPEKRRKMFVTFISADLATMDINSAFILGANLTVSKKDVKRLDRFLAQGMREHERLYATFYEVEQEIQAETA